MKSWSEVAVPSLNFDLAFPDLLLTNSASGTKEVVPSKAVYRMYVCGITPYDATHLGHAATYLTFDLINRYLRVRGSEVRYVQNITDIDDPLLERAKRDGVEWDKLAHQQIDLFRGDMVNLRVIPPAHYIGAVDAIPLVTEAGTAFIPLTMIFTFRYTQTKSSVSVHALLRKKCCRFSRNVAVILTELVRKILSIA